MSQNDPLYALTPIDGRYQCKLKDLSAISCEYNLIKLRLFLEIKYLIALSQLGIAPKLNSQQKLDLLNIFLETKCPPVIFQVCLISILL